MSVCVAATYAGRNANVFGVDAHGTAAVQFVDGCSPYCLTRTQHDTQNQICAANLQSCRPQPLLEEDQASLSNKQKLAGTLEFKEHPENSMMEEPVIMEILNGCADRFVSNLFTSAICDDLDDSVYEVDFDPDDTDDEASVISDEGDDLVSFKVEDLRIRARRMFLEASRNGRLKQAFFEVPQKTAEASNAVVSLEFSSTAEDDYEDVCSLMSEDDLCEERGLAQQAMQLIQSAVEAGLREEFPEEFLETDPKKALIGEDFATASTCLEPTEAGLAEEFLEESAEFDEYNEPSEVDEAAPAIVKNVSIAGEKSTQEFLEAKNLLKHALVRSSLDGRLATALSHVLPPGAKQAKNHLKHVLVRASLDGKLATALSHVLPPGDKQAKNHLKAVLVRASLDGKLAIALSHVFPPGGKQDEDVKDIREPVREILEEPSTPEERVLDTLHGTSKKDIGDTATVFDGLSMNENETAEGRSKLFRPTPKQSDWLVSCVNLQAVPSKKSSRKAVEEEPAATFVPHQPASAEMEAKLINSANIQMFSLADVSNDKVKPKPEASPMLSASSPLTTRSMQSCKSKRRIIGGVVRAPTAQEPLSPKTACREPLSPKTHRNRQASMQKQSPITYCMDLDDDKINFNKDTVQNPKTRASSITKGYDALGVEFHRLDTLDDDAWHSASVGRNLFSAVQFSSSVRSATGLSGAHANRVPVRSASAMALDLGVNTSIKSARRSGRAEPASSPPRPAGAPPDLLRPMPPAVKATKTGAKLTKPGLLPSLSGPILSTSQCSAGSVAWSVHMAKAARMRVAASTVKF